MVCSGTCVHRSVTPKQTCILCVYVSGPFAYNIRIMASDMTAVVEDKDVQDEELTEEPTLEKQEDGDGETPPTGEKGGGGEGEGTNEGGGEVAAKQQTEVGEGF